MTIYHRHFNIKDDETVLELDSLFIERNKYFDQLTFIQEEVGATGYRVYARNLEFAGFTFTSTPDKEHWKKVKGLWLPKKKSPIGRALANKIESLTLPSNMNTVLVKHGLRIDFAGALVEGLSWHYPSVCGATGKGWFATIPWKDVSPETINNYKKYGDVGGYGKTELEHLSWEKPGEWIEVKEWEVLNVMEAK